MKETKIIKIKDIKLNNPIMIEGLPGIGHVGKLVAEHMVEELGAEKIMDIYSQHFPPQVIVQNNVARLLRNEIYAYKNDQQDLLIIIGDHQSVTNAGHYELCGLFLDIAQQFGVKRIYTLGGYGIGQLIETNTVICAVNNPDLLEEMLEYGVEFRENEPGGGIIGVSGLLLGLGRLRGIDSVCLMGITSGYMVDPKSAQAVLKILCKILNLNIDMYALEERAKEMEKIVEKVREMEQLQTPYTSDGEDLGYIG